jgi:hypothetical protein
MSSVSISIWLTARVRVSLLALLCADPVQRASPRKSYVSLGLPCPLIMGSPRILLIEMPRRCHVAASLSLSLCRPSEGKVYQLSGDPCLVARLSLSLSLAQPRYHRCYRHCRDVLDPFQITTICCYRKLEAVLSDLGS